MKFEKLHLEKYGLYENRTLTFARDAHLHVIVGANEAGKTSALSAIGDLLFGFPNASKYAIGYSPNAMRIGAMLLLQDGAVVSFRRRKGRANTLIDEIDKALGDDFLDPVLRNIDRDTFEQEYGLTAERLRKGGGELLAAEGKLADSLAAGLAGLSAVNRLKARLQGEANELFTPRKSASKLFYLAADEYSAKTKELREAIVTADAVKQAEAECERLVAQQKALEDEHAKISPDLKRLQRARRTQTKLAEIAATETVLAGLADLPAIDAALAERWRKAQAEIAETTESLAAAGRKQAAARQAIAALHCEPALLQEAVAIAGLRESLGAAEKSRADLPNRETEQHAIMLRLQQAARDLDLVSPDELIAKAPKPPALARVQAAIAQRREMQIKRRALEDNLKKARQRCTELAREAETQGHAADPAPLQDEFERFADVPQQAGRLRQLGADRDQALSDLATRVQRLTPAAPPLDDLVRMPLPDMASIDAARRERDELVRQKNKLHGDLGECLTRIADLERKLEVLSRRGQVATHADLAAARAERDAALSAVQAAMQAEEAASLAKLAALREANLTLDRITDSLLGGADRAAQKQAMEQELASARDGEQHLRGLLAECNDGVERAAEAWAELWRASGIEPVAPDGMRDWHSKVQDIVARHDQLAAARADIAALRDRLGEIKPALADFLARLSGAAAKNLPAEDLHEAARKTLAALHKRWNERREQAALLKSAEQNAAELEAALIELDALTAQSPLQWAADMAAIGRAETVGPEEAEKALEIWRTAGAEREKLENVEHRIAAMRDDIKSFAAGVAGFCARFATDLAASEARGALNELEKRVQEFRQAAAERQRLEGEAKSLQQEIEQSNKQQASARAMLGEAQGALGAESAKALATALERLSQREAACEELARRHNDLNHIADGVALDDLRAEQAGIDHDAVDGEIDRLELRAGQLLDEMKEAAVLAERARRALAGLVEGRNAAALAQQKQEAAAELLDIARRWLMRAGAARLAGQVIERHRQSAQDPVVARVSELFGHATAGQFQGLGVRYGDDDQPVFRAVRAGGEDVPVEGLSDGTRDQLFLALRLALLERRGGEPMPFIGDDLLTSFDDNRTGQAIDMLAEFGQQRQVILFSHHRHVADIARQRLGGRLDLIEL